MYFCVYLMKDQEHVGHVVRMSVSGYRGRRFEPRHQYGVSLSKTLYPHCFSRLSCNVSTRWDNLMKGVQCYELFGGIALKKSHIYLFIHLCLFLLCMSFVTCRENCLAVVCICRRVTLCVT